MNFVESSRKIDDGKTKKMSIIIIVAIVVLLITSIILFLLINQLKEEQFKFSIDGKSVAVTNDLFIFEEDEVYVSIKDISTLIGYTYFNGGYKQYSEDTNSCYLQCENEICTFENQSNKIYKTPKDTLDYQYLLIDKPVKLYNDKLYISSKGLRNACNVEFSYSKEQNEIVIYTLPYLTTFYTTGKYVKSGIKGNFNNQKAILYNMLVMQNADNTDVDNEGKQKNKENIRYGVSDLNGKEIIGTKYTDIEFIENTKEFIVKTEEGKVGIISDNGETKVKPQYDALKQIDKDLNLYLATNNNKKGIIEKNGKILIYLEYDEIGIDASEFENNNIKNPYILYNNAIPVKQNNKWGLYNIKGEWILPLNYDGIGCVANENTVNSTAIIPSVDGIVVARKYMVEDETSNSNPKKMKEITLYGIVSSKGNVDVDTGLESVYFIINNGREEYTMVTYQGDKYDVVDFYNKNIYTKQNRAAEASNTNTIVNNSIDDNTITANTTNTTNTTSTNNITNTYTANN
ncbi:MAG: WG repeat-containing protein [Clostridia bacterium]|nr:WG repeat-containing protein [Clostridia bacterium]